MNWLKLAGVSDEIIWNRDSYNQTEIRPVSEHKATLTNIGEKYRILRYISTK